MSQLLNTIPVQSTCILSVASFSDGGNCTNTNPSSSYHHNSTKPQSPDSHTPVLNMTALSHYPTHSRLFICYHVSAGRHWRYSVSLISTLWFSYHITQLTYNCCNSLLLLNSPVHLTFVGECVMPPSSLTSVVICVNVICVLHSCCLSP